MIVGIGTDIVAVSRLRGMWERYGERVLNKLLAPSEYADFDRATDKGRFLAKRFAAKEAFAKAIGTGIRPPVLLPFLAVSHDVLGKPYFIFHRELLDLVAQRSMTSHLSLSDEAEYVIAYVLLEQA